jgi:hypothetical protein
VARTFWMRSVAVDDPPFARSTITRLRLAALPAGGSNICVNASVDLRREDWAQAC